MKELISVLQEGEREAEEINFKAGMTVVTGRLSARPEDVLGAMTIRMAAEGDVADDFGLVRWQSYELADSFTTKQLRVIADEIGL